MKIDVNIRKGAKKDLVEKVLAFYVKELNLERSSWMMVVDSVKGMLDDEGNGFVAGVCSPVPRLLVMALDSKMPMSEIVETIAHEMIHVKQYATGRLRFEAWRGKSVAYWNGKRQPHHEYLDMPWERHAFREQKLLKYSYLQSTR
jgi:hypothetical protein